MTDTERIDRLEKNYEWLYHETELILSELVKTHDWINKHVEIDKNFSARLLERIEGIKDYSLITDRQMQEHFRSHTYRKKDRL